MKRIYIAGKITGLDRQAYIRRFLHAENMLIEKFEIVNPIFLERLNLDDSLHRDAIMEICKVLISTCDAIYMLSNWESSPGARMERDYAKSLGLEILYEQEDKYK